MNRNLTPIRVWLVLSAVFLLADCGNNADVGPAQQIQSAAAQQQQPTTTKQQAPAAQNLTALLASDSRAAADRARDSGRKPADVIAFLGIEPGMNVMDVIAAGGYYTEVLSLAVGPGGHVASQNPAFVLKMREGVNEKALSKRLANERLPNVTRLDEELNDISPPDGPFDAAITALNLHDIYNNSGEEGAVNVLKAIYSALKPGGIFGVIDHQGIEGNDNKPLHRIPKATAISLVEAAGFVVEQSSDILQMPGDDMTQAIFAKGVRGKTNRFVLRLRKPAN